MLVCQDNKWSVLHWWLHQPQNLFFSPTNHPLLIILQQWSSYTTFPHILVVSLDPSCSSGVIVEHPLLLGILVLVLCILWPSTSRSSSLRGSGWTQFPCRCSVWKVRIAPCRMRQILSFSVEPVPWRTIHDGHSLLEELPSWSWPRKILLRVFFKAQAQETWHKGLCALSWCPEEGWLSGSRMDAGQLQQQSAPKYQFLAGNWWIGRMNCSAFDFTGWGISNSQCSYEQICQ